MRRMLLLFASTGLAACVVAQQPATSPANESREPVTVRSTNSIGSDRTVPLCPQHFHDSLARDGVAGRGDHGITPARIKTTVPALMTQQAIEAAGGTHIGNFNVIVNALVDRKGLPHDLCLQKSSGYGLDASAAKAVGQYRFHPAMKNGKPVRIRVPVEVRFVSENPPPMGTPHSGLPQR